MQIPVYNDPTFQGFYYENDHKLKNDKENSNIEKVQFYNC